MIDFEAIKADEKLQAIIKQHCEDEGMCVSFDEKLKEIDYLILKVDDFYNSLQTEFRPPSPDCMIVIPCIGGGYKLVIVELKGIKKNRHFDINNVTEKFRTCLNDFILTRFSQHFAIEYNTIELLFVTNIDIYRGELGLSMQLLMRKKFTYKGRNYLIKPSEPQKAIKPCYAKYK